VSVDAPLRTRPATADRPSKPKPSPMRLVAAAAVLVLTWLSASALTGIDLVGRLQRTFADGIPERLYDNLREIANPAWGSIGATVDPFLETVAMAVLGTIFGCTLALVVAFGASEITAGGRKRLAVTRSLMSIVRSVPDVMWALIFVSAVGTGTISGLLALVLFNIGVVAKLLSETIDAVDTGPLEAADAAGAGIVARARASVFPQVLPNYLAFSLYAFELNVRASAVLGLVGAGGIGQLLNDARTRFFYEGVSLIVIEIFVFVFITEAISIALRRRLTE
jgi:phosphonate transport system permease protein